MVRQNYCGVNRGGSSTMTNSRLVGWSQWVGATPSNINPLFKGGVYDPRKTGGAFCGAAEPAMEPQSQLDKIALRLNQRPRKTLGFQTPVSKLRASVAPTL